MDSMIKLDNYYEPEKVYYVNPSHIMLLKHSEFGTELYVSGLDYYINIKQTPEEIMELIKISKSCEENACKD